jgi:hypothetical protein
MLLMLKVATFTKSLSVTMLSGCPPKLNKVNRGFYVGDSQGADDLKEA